MSLVITDITEKLQQENKKIYFGGGGVDRFKDGRSERTNCEVSGRFTTSIKPNMKKQLKFHLPSKIGRKKFA
jgi:hypothetical protein